MKNRLLNTDRYFFNLPGTWTPHNVLQCILVSKRMALGLHHMQNNPSFKTWVCSSTSSFPSKNMISPKRLTTFGRMLAFFPIQCTVWVHEYLLRTAFFYADIRLQHGRCCKVCNHPGQNLWELCWFVLWRHLDHSGSLPYARPARWFRDHQALARHMWLGNRNRWIFQSQVLEPQKNHQNEIKHVQASKQLQVRQIVWHIMTYPICAAWIIYLIQHANNVHM